MLPAITRRSLTRTFLACAAPSLVWATSGTRLKTRLAAIDKRCGGRLGVAFLDTATGAVIAHRGNERFPMCSTFKASAVAFVLQRVDRGEEKLDRRIIFRERDVLAYAPVARLHVGGEGMTVADLCAAAITVSDNTAANLLLASFGGPAALTRFWRSIGDEVTRLDRIEGALNEATPGDPRDTTSPVAMMKTIHRLVSGGVLSQQSRDTFASWLIANTTGDACLRRGLPKTWKVGDKTGSGGNQTRNDIAVIWPPEGKSLVVTAYLTQAPGNDDARNAVLAEVGHAVADEIAALS